MHPCVQAPPKGRKLVTLYCFVSCPAGRMIARPVCLYHKAKRWEPEPREVAKLEVQGGERDYHRQMSIIGLLRRNLVREAFP